MPNYYDVLGVNKSATADEIRKAYKKIARENHPDVKPDDKAAAERFKQASEAYAVLGDKDKREQYDQFGDAYKYAQAGGPFPGGRSQGSGPIDIQEMFGGEVDLEDLFGGMFGGGGGPRRAAQPRPRRGHDARTTIEVPFQVAADGGTWDVSLRRDGSTETLSVKVPAGVEDGQTIRLGGQGEPGMQGGPAGDLLITVRVAPHPYFRREGNNVLIDVPISITEAALGAKVDVPTLKEGQVTLTIPPGTSSGSKLRIRGKGFVDRRTKQPGDQLVVVRITAPKRLNERARELLNELRELAPDNPRAGLW
jgi:DnaJ-class molecular chaperone